MIQLYDAALSGNAYKARLFLALLGLDYEKVTVDLAAGGQKAPEYTALNPFGQVPALVDGDVVLRDSQAILVYLAGKYGDDTWLPGDPADAARVQQWLSTAENEIQYSLAMSRALKRFGFPGNLERAQQRSHALLAIMDGHLTDREWLECGRPTIADLACYPYIATAAEGGVPLDDYAAVRAWLDRVAALSGYVPMT